MKDLWTLETATERCAMYRSALLRFGEHLPYCPCRLDPPADCTCGLSGVIGLWPPDLKDAIKAAVEAERKRLLAIMEEYRFCYDAQAAIRARSNEDRAGN